MQLQVSLVRQLRWWGGRLIPVSKLTGYKTLLPPEAFGCMLLVRVYKVNDEATTSSATLSHYEREAQHVNNSLFVN